MVLQISDNSTELRCTTGRSAAMAANINEYDNYCAAANVSVENLKWSVAFATNGEKMVACSRKRISCTFFSLVDSYSGTYTNVVFAGMG